MLSKVFKSMFSTVPNVWVNKHTKVICQGITGNQVTLLPLRAPSKHNKHSTMAHKWSVESTQKKQEPPISVYPSSKIASKPKKPQEPMLQSSTCLHPEQPMQLLRHSKQNSISVSSSQMVNPFSTQASLNMI